MAKPVTALTFTLKLTIVTAVVALGLFALPARAQDGTTLALSEHAERNLPRDRLVAELVVEASDADVAHVQAEINRRMAEASARAKAVPAVTVTTGAYSVYEERPDKAPPRWHGRQELHLEAKDRVALLQLIGTLQGDGLSVSSLNAVLSREAASAVEDELTDEALKRLRERAARIAAALGLQVESIGKLTIGNAAVPSQPIRYRFSATAATAAAPPPVVEAGDATVAVSIEAEIELTPK